MDSVMLAPRTLIERLTPRPWPEHPVLVYQHQVIDDTWEQITSFSDNADPD
jgi:hypothetical protein